MFWLLLSAIVASTIALVWIAWRKWIAPWRHVDELVSQIGRGERPRTFLIDGGTGARSVGLRLEEIFQDLKQLDKQIAKRESGLQTIFAAMEDALLVVDSDRRVILANETFRSLFALDEISGRPPLLEIVRATELERLIVEALRSGEARQTELAINTSEFELHAAPTRNAAGEISGAVVLFHDITQLRQTDKVRRDFVANVSHELRTPLSILRGYIETLRDSPKTSRDELMRILEVMERHSKRLGLLVEDLLTLAELESADPNLQLGDVRLAEMLDNIVHDWERKLAEKRLKAVVELAPDMPKTIRVDETRLQEILFNLLDNAVKYSRENGEIRLRAERRDVVAGVGDPGKDAVVLSVSDNGVGIAKEDLPRIFERFYRADKARSRELGGTGLGLAIVKHIAQLHGGRVEAESELGQGTAIRVILPMGGSK